jgi:uncharacterized protein YkwD
VSTTAGRITLIAAALALALAALFVAEPGRAGAELDAEEQAFLPLLNEYRAANGSGPLSLNDQLSDAARWMADDMAAHDNFSHTDTLGRNTFERIAAFGSDPFFWLGENLAVSSGGTAQWVLEAWKASPGHNANMLNGLHNSIGIARARSATGIWYWVIDLGALAGQPITTPSPSPTPEPTPEPQSADIPLYDGWNLVSLPLIPSDPDPAAVLASIAGSFTIAWGYDPDLDNPWLDYDPNAPAISTLVAIDETMGFWLHMTRDATLTVTGAEPETTNIPISTGWNLFGYPSGDPAAVDQLLAGIDFDQLWAFDPLAPKPWSGYDPDTPGSNDLEHLQEGRGYALHAGTPAVITVANGGAAAALP